MLTVETIGWIRREHLDKGKSIREIARTLHLSRNTVRRILRSGETAFHMNARSSRGRSSERVRTSSIGCWRRTQRRRRASV
jgi:AraC-like DNA-binding protein